MKKHIFFLVLFIFTCSLLPAQSLKRVKPKTVGINEKHLIYADRVIDEAIEKNDIPGAVLAIVKDKKLAYLKAYGNKQVFPDTICMTSNTVFDLASVSKSVSTSICVMILLERGELRLSDNVSNYIPDFTSWKDTVSGRAIPVKIVDLLTHTSGLPAYAPVGKLREQYSAPNPDGLITYISTVERKSKPGSEFGYSCLNFIALQRIIENISGMSLREFAQQNIFKPLNMKHTDYNPFGETLSLTAPTQKQTDGTVIRGIVHDPLAHIMNGGISGNAGVFSNAEDLAVLCAMLLNHGEINGTRILHPLTVRAMRSVPKGYEKFGRSLGWDVYSRYASDGDLFDTEAYGHTGYTGTSITIDQETGTAVILLTNRVHPVDKGTVVRLREVVANIVAASLISY